MRLSQMEFTYSVIEEYGNSKLYANFDHIIHFEGSLEEIAVGILDKKTNIKQLTELVNISGHLPIWWNDLLLKYEKVCKLKCFI